MTPEQETPQQKAERLGVPIIPLLPNLPQPIKDDKPMQAYKDGVLKIINTPTSVCGACGKVITLATKSEPCGNMYCPFGFITNQ